MLRGGVWETRHDNRSTDAYRWVSAEERKKMGNLHTNAGLANGVDEGAESADEGAEAAPDVHETPILAVGRPAAGADGTIGGSVALEAQMGQGRKMKEKGPTKAVAVPGSEGEKPEMDEARALATAVLAAAAGEVRCHPKLYSERAHELAARDLVTPEALEGRSIDLRATVNIAIPAVARVEASIGDVVLNLLLGSRTPANVSQRLYAGHVEPEGGLWDHRECGSGGTRGGTSGPWQRMDGIDESQG
ncbi:hypothetical protein C8F04DRAFT_1179539 [Mycena alexandri]|uniref:Uncharacterized protein n=1 Tax=Mycena alexandri TaxID=1745969 RepID=A0AAD6T3A0_9AGAR|nr:hypothetical protein C8F04DRAFT_1179539 [Mycena alexandri]